jgi:hypothetical protein
LKTTATPVPDPEPTSTPRVTEPAESTKPATTTPAETTTRTEMPRQATTAAIGRSKGLGSGCVLPLLGAGVRQSNAKPPADRWIVFLAWTSCWPWPRSDSFC